MRHLKTTNVGDDADTQDVDNNSRIETVGTVGDIGVWPSDWDIRRLHMVPKDLPVSRLRCRNAWNSLTDSQQHFVHHFGRASWAGARICAHQVSQVKTFNRSLAFGGLRASRN